LRKTRVVLAAMRRSGGRSRAWRDERIRGAVRRRSVLSRKTLDDLWRTSMRAEPNSLSLAVRWALKLGGTAAGAIGIVHAQTPAPAAVDQKSQSLETIVVTGSNIRRVDIETANPVVTIDRAQIQASGKVNLGDLVQQLPSMAGSPLTPQVNNGGTGTAGVSLRGLGSNRTLLLVNGHRIPFQLQDLNLLPVSIVERIEILNDGASAVYGSDAIGGVVNIITRTNYQGAEFGADYGIADADDGKRTAYHAIFGQTTDKGSIVVGIQYDKQEPVSAANRDFSRNAQYIYNTGINTHGGSSRTPGGRFFLPAGSAIANQFGCTSVTLSGNQLPSQTTPPTASQFRCYSSLTDGFNFQAVGNYDLIPNERTSLFALGNYKLTDSVEAYLELLHHKMVAHTQLAPYPFDLTSNALIVPPDQYYNPFGVTFGTTPTSTIALRLTSVGNRGGKLAVTTQEGNFGFKGTFGDSSWNWDAHISYGKLTNESQAINYLNISTIAPSFGCTTAPGVGACTPIDIFNQSDPNTIAIFNAAAINPFLTFLYQTKTAEVSANGTLFTLPAGDVQAAIGALYRKEYLHNDVDPLINTTFSAPGGVPTLSCPGPSSICTSPAQGGFDVKEAYAELLIPVLKDLPFVHSLNVDIGDRYSKYSNFGSTSNWKAAIEFRPIEDLLLRATVSKVFRAPTPTDLFAGPGADAPTATDPCGGHPELSGNAACQGFNVPPQVFSQLSGYVMGSQFAQQNGLSDVVLQPEFGKSFDYGFVYDPGWLPGLSLNADYFRILLNNLIVSGPGIALTILTLCFNTQGDICSLIVRAPDGSIKFVTESSFNSGNLVDQGFDIGAHYRLPETAWGNFRVGFDATYVQKWNVDQGGFVQHLAGHFDKTFGNFARVRALASLDWNLGPWSANWTTRYIGRITLGYANSGLGPSGVASSTNAYNPNPIGPVLHYGAQTYHNFSVGYRIEPINGFVQFGVDNVFDKAPPILYQNNVLNANTDVNTYDTVGRYYHASVSVKF
jgi:outer membrane receptor protein involved in Fe transport